MDWWRSCNNGCPLVNNIIPTTQVVPEVMIEVRTDQLPSDFTGRIRLREAAMSRTPNINTGCGHPSPSTRSSGLSVREQLGQAQPAAAAVKTGR